MVNIYESIKQLHDESIQQQIAIISLQTTITTEQASQQTSFAKLQASLNHAYHLLLDLSTKVSSLTTSSPNSFINNPSPIGINYSQVANTHNLNLISNSSFSPSPLSKNRNPSNINYDIDIFDSSLNASNPQILKFFSDPHIEFVVGIPDSSVPSKTALSNNIDTSVSIITTPDNTPLPIAPFIQPPQLLLTSSLSTLLPSYSTTNRVPYQSASALLMPTKADSSGSTTSTNSTSQAPKLASSSFLTSFPYLQNPVSKPKISTLAQPIMSDNICKTLTTPLSPSVPPASAHSIRTLLGFHFLPSSTTTPSICPPGSNPCSPSSKLPLLTFSDPNLNHRFVFLINFENLTLRQTFVPSIRSISCEIPGSILRTTWMSLNLGIF